MSKIQGVPFIQSVINSLTAELKNDLLDLVNGEEKTPVFRSLINKQHAITAGTDKNKVQFVFLETWNKNYTGYLIYNNSYCVLVGFNANTQDMSIVNIDVSKQTYNLVKQPLSILEFRFCLQDAAEHITSDEIDSGSAAAGQVLAADGEGGTEWSDVADAITEDNVSEGDAVKLFGFDAQGNLVQDDIPEGIVVDETIIEDSPNAVAGGAVYDALEEIGGDITDINAELETKANVDGNYPTMTVGVADQLSPYDDESGDDQDEPFSFQATGTGNGTQPDFSTGSIALMKEKQGNSVVVNQIYKNEDFSTSEENGITYTRIDEYSWSLNGTAIEQTTKSILIGSSLIFNHKYIILNIPKQENFGIQVNGSQNFFNIDTMLFTYTTEDNIRFAQKVGASFTNQTVTLKVIDLTQWFGSNDNIPADLLAHPENFFRYYQGSLAYNTGELVNANSRYLKAIGRQQWDEEWELGTFNADGSLNNTENNIRSKNYIKVIPNATYYLKFPSGVTMNFIALYDKEHNFIDAIGASQSGTISISSNVCFIKFAMNDAYGTTYNNDITISIYYEDESGYDQYYPYEVLTNNDTGTETLRSAGNVCDIKKPDGTITRRVGYVDLSTLTWAAYSSTYHVYSSTSLRGIIKNGEYSSRANAVCDKWLCMAQSDISTERQVFFVASDGELYFFTDDSEHSPTGTLFYELAEPTTEQGTPYSENIVIDDFGSMDFSGTSGVPQGNLIFYPVDYKAFIDTLYDYTEGTPSNIALKSDLTGLVAQEDKSNDITDNASLTYSVKKAYKDGKLVFVNIKATNSTGSAISAGTTLFTLGSGLRPIDTLTLPCSKGLSNDVFICYASSGECSIAGELADSSYVSISIFYAVA